MTVPFRARRILSLTAILVSITTLAGSPPCVQAEPERWWEVFGSVGFDDVICTGVVYNGDLIIGGAFSRFNQTPLGGIARWDGTGWVPLGEPLDGHVAALLIVDGELWVGGHFTLDGGQSISNAARWNGRRFSPAGNPETFVNCFAVHEGQVHLGGEDYDPVRVWDGKSWSVVGAGQGPLNRVYTLASFQGKLVAGGKFQRLADDTPVNAIAEWDGQSWSDLAGGVHRSSTTRSYVRTLFEYNGELLVGGEFRRAGSLDGISTPGVARWDGAAWSSMGDLSNFWFHLNVAAFHEHGGTLYAAGGFDANGTDGLATWNGTAWLPVPGEHPFGIEPQVTGLATFEGELVTLGAIAAMTRPDGWVVLGTPDPGGGFDAPVYSLIEWQGEIIAGGNFRMAGGKPAWHLARWDGIHWHEFGGGADDPVMAFEVYGGDLIAAGDFLKIGSRPLNGIARWTGDDWVELGGGITENPLLMRITDMTVFEGDLVVCGRFDEMGGVPVANIARWNGTTWSDLGGGFTGCSGTINAVVVHNGVLFAGGTFLMAGDNSIHHLARWTGTQWAMLRPGIDESCERQILDDVSERVSVDALLPFQGKLAIGGNFLGPSDTRHLAFFGPWHSPVPTLTPSGWSVRVRDLAALGDRLFATGAFSESETGAANILSYDHGTGTWSGLGDGLDGWGRALLISNGLLYVGGDFTHVDGFESNHIAVWGDLTVPVNLLHMEATRLDAGVRLRWEIAGQDDGIPGFRVLRDDEGSRQIVSGTVSGRTSYEFLDTQAPSRATSYWIDEVRRDGSTSLHGPLRVGASDALTLRIAATPNPFNQSTRILLQLPQASRVDVDVFDIRGRRVVTLASDRFEAGPHEIEWDGRSREGISVPAGIYLVQVRIPETSASVHKLIKF